MYGIRVSRNLKRINKRRSVLASMKKYLIKLNGSIPPNNLLIYIARLFFHFGFSLNLVPCRN